MNAKTQALRDVEDNSERIERKKAEAEKKETELVAEEKVLERIRDSLKGQSLLILTLDTSNAEGPLDKTQVFHDQIEAKQKELQPWMSKINAKQAEIDVASSERDALVKKAEAAEAARKEAEETLNNLRSDLEVKVSVGHFES